MRPSLSWLSYLMTGGVDSRMAEVTSLTLGFCFVLSKELQEYCESDERSARTIGRPSS